MPLRPVIPAFPRGHLLRRQFVERRQFHDSASLRQASGGIDGRNYYEILEVPVNATANEIKKSFYHLSKTHHPDHNPSDPHASTRFVSISTAYTTLSNPASRLTYDRTYLLSNTSTPHRTHPQGSHFSGSPAGGRPASGLSRRRTQFRGPPPSFYRSGGWGDMGEKREAAASQSHAHAYADGTHPHARPNYNSHPNSAFQNAKPSSGPYPPPDSNEVPHFNRHQHLQSQTNVDARRRARARFNRMMDEKALREGGGPGGITMFIWVGGILGIAVGLPAWALGR